MNWRHFLQAWVNYLTDCVTFLCGILWINRCPLTRLLNLKLNPMSTLSTSRSCIGIRWWTTHSRKQRPGVNIKTINISLFNCCQSAGEYSKPFGRCNYEKKWQMPKGNKKIHKRRVHLPSKQQVMWNNKWNFLQKLLS